MAAWVPYNLLPGFIAAHSDWFDLGVLEIGRLPKIMEEVDVGRLWRDVSVVLAGLEVLPRLARVISHYLEGHCDFVLRRSIQYRHNGETSPQS